MPKFETSTQCYTALTQRLAEAVTEPWDRIVVDVEIVSMNIVSHRRVEYSPKANPQLVKPVALDVGALSECFSQLASLIAVPGRDRFKKCRFRVSSDGQYRADFQY